MNFQNGLANLENVLRKAQINPDSDVYLDFTGWKRQLLETVEEERRFAGLSPQGQERRERILRELDRLALGYAGKSFADLCESKPTTEMLQPDYLFQVQGERGKPPKTKEDTFYYDVALSFAGENRGIVRQVYEALMAAGIKTFYDDDEDVKAELWGKNLYDYLSDLYRNRARYCIIFVSKDYVRKVWPNHERQAAQVRALQENREYILPLRLDDTEIPGLLPTVAYLDLRHETIDAVVQSVRKKLGTL